MLLFAAEVEEQLGVLLGFEHVLGDRVGRGRAAQRRQVRLRVRQRVGHRVRRHVCVGRHLHRDLAAGRQRRDPLAKHRCVIGNPLQAGAGEHQIDIAGRRPAADVALVELHAGIGVFVRGCQHRRRVVEPEHSLDVERTSRKSGQLTGAAAEIDRRADRPRPDQREQIVERLGTLGSELAVLLGVPVSHRHDLYSTCMHLLLSRPKTARAGSRDPARVVARSCRCPLEGYEDVNSDVTPTSSHMSTAHWPATGCRLSSSVSSNAVNSSPVSAQSSNWMTPISSKR